MFAPIRPLSKLSGTDVVRFLREDWQRRPRLFRAAFAPDFCSLTPDTIFDLAARDDAESRLVTHFGGRWHLTHGPLARNTLPLRRPGQWTVLVQGVNLFVSEIDRLMQRFRFIVDARLDDVMASYAVDGGGVGPHVDSYDVFLLQASGTRRWRIGRQSDTAPAPDTPLKQLARFAPTREWTLGPGDMLYLPPGVAHEGTAVGTCITLSIGFRTPSWTQLAESWFDRAAPRVQTAPEYRDRSPRPSRAAAQLPDALIRATAAALERLRPRRADAEHALLAWLSEPKSHVAFTPQRRLSRDEFRHVLNNGVVVPDLRTRLLYRGTRVGINGEVWTPARPALSLLRRLADDRVLRGGAVTRGGAAAVELFHDAFRAGWLHIIRG